MSASNVNAQPLVVQDDLIFDGDRFRPIPNTGLFDVTSFIEYKVTLIEGNSFEATRIEVIDKVTGQVVFLAFSLAELRQGVVAVDFQRRYVLRVERIRKVTNGIRSRN